MFCKWQDGQSPYNCFALRPAALLFFAFPYGLRLCWNVRPDPILFKGGQASFCLPTIPPGLRLGSAWANHRAVCPPWLVDIVGCADEGGASFAIDGLRKLSASYGPFFFYVASLRRCVRHAFCFSRSAAWPYRCVKIFCLTQRRNDATLIRVSGSRIAPLVERGIIRRNARSTAIAPLYAPYRVVRRLCII